MEIEHEPQATPEGVPPAYWPASGDLRVEKLSAQYSQVSRLGLVYARWQRPELV